MKTCSKCKVEKESDQFSKGANKDGLSSWCKDCARTLSKSSHYASRRSNPAKALLSYARGNARRAGIEFNLTVEDCFIPEVCPVLGIPLVPFAEKVNGNINPNSPSLDKMIPSRGYTKGNVQVISWRANRLKSDATLQELESICKYMRYS
jgi:hypothetical protein